MANGSKNDESPVIPEMRKDPTSGRWSVVARKEKKGQSARYKEPDSDHYLNRLKTPLEGKACPFSRSYGGGKRQEKDPVFGLRWKGDEVELVWHENEAERGKLWHSEEWEVMLVEHDFAQVNRYITPYVFGQGPFLSLAGYGIHDMIIEDPTEDHKPLGVMPWKRTMLILLAMLYRMKGDLGLKNSIPCFPKFNPEIVKPLSKTDGIRHVSFFHNYLRDAGASQEHPHSQIVASPIIPTDVATELAYLLKRYNEPPGRCIYCQVIETEINNRKRERVLFENDSFLAIHPYAPVYPFETWILPKKHSPSFEDIIPEDYSITQSNPLEDLAKIVNDVIGRLYVSLLNPGYNLLLKTAPILRFGEQKYEFHWHIRIEPRSLYKPAGFESGTGIFSCETPPEKAVDFLQGWGVLSNNEKCRGSLRWYIARINELKKNLDQSQPATDEEIQVAWNANHLLEILPQGGRNIRDALELRGILDELMKKHIQLQRSQYQKEYTKEDKQRLQSLSREFEETEGPHYRSDLTTERWVLIPSKKRRKGPEKHKDSVAEWHRDEAREIANTNPLNDANGVCPFCQTIRNGTQPEDKNNGIFGLKEEKNKISLIAPGAQFYNKNGTWDIFVNKNAYPILGRQENKNGGIEMLPILKGSGVFQQIEGKGICDVIVIGDGSDASYIKLDKDSGEYGVGNNCIDTHRSLGQMDEKYTKLVLYAIMMRLGAPKDIFKNGFSINGTRLDVLLEESIYRQSEPIPGPVIKHATIFSNHGKDAGARFAHPTWQIIGTPVIPNEILRELAHAKAYSDNNSGRCCFCDMIGAELEQARAEKRNNPNGDEKPVNRIIYPKPDDNGIIPKSDFIVLAPYAARVPFELWILPREHQTDMIKMNHEQVESLAKILYDTLRTLSEAVDDPPYSLIIKNAPIAPEEHKNMYAHYHWRIIIEPQRLAIDAGYEHLTGIWSNPTPPEEYAKYLREKWKYR